MHASFVPLHWWLIPSNLFPYFCNLPHSFVEMKENINKCLGVINMLYYQTPLERKRTLLLLIFIVSNIVCTSPNFWGNIFYYNLLLHSFLIKLFIKGCKCWIMGHKRLLEEIENIFNIFSVSSQMFTLCQANVVNMLWQSNF